MPTLRTTPSRIDQKSDDVWIRFLPAWLGSLFIHAFVLLAIGLTWIAQPATAPFTTFAAAYVADLPAAEFQQDGDFRQQSDTAIIDEAMEAASDSRSPLDDSVPFGVHLDTSASALNEALAPLDSAEVLSLPGKPGERSSSGGSSQIRGADIAARLLGGTGSERTRTEFGKGRTSFYGITAEGSKFVYVFDRSGSMEGSPLRSAKGELIASIELLDDVSQFQIVFYNHDIQVFSLAGDPRRIVFGTAANKARAKRYIYSVDANGGTDHEPALRAALSMRPDVIYFLTDADQPPLTRGQLDSLHKANAGATIHAIEFGIEERTVHDNFLFRLAQENGGAYKYINVRTALKN